MGYYYRSVWWWPFISIQWLSADPGRTKRHQVSASTLAPHFSLFLSLFDMRHSARSRRSAERWDEDDGTTTDPLANAHTHRWVDTLPLSGSLVGTYLHAPSWIWERWWVFVTQRPQRAQAPAKLVVPLRAPSSAHAPTGGGMRRRQAAPLWYPTVGTQQIYGDPNMWRPEHAMAVTRFYPRGDKSSTTCGGAPRCCTADDELLPSRCLKSTSVMSADLV
jgi:hypothetical protein